MISRHLYIQIVFRVLLLFITTIVGSWLLFYSYYVWLGLLLLVLIFQVVWLINYINSTNKKIAFFFNAVKNDDFTLQFSEDEKVKSFKELYKSLNRLNEKIQQTYIKNQAQEKYYLEIIKQADIGIMTIDKDGHILIANPKAEKLLNYTPLNHINQLKYVDTEMFKTIEKKEVFDKKMIELITEREKKQLSLKSSSILLNNNKLLLVIMQDIRKELEDKEADSWVKLIKVLTHEIMNSIAPITSLSNSLLTYFNIEVNTQIGQKQIQNTKEGLKVIQEQSKSLTEFVQSYRSLLNIPKPNKQIVLARDLIEKITLMMNEPTIKFDTSIQPNNLELFVDEVQIKLVLINLIKNAIQSFENHQEKNISISVFTDDDNHKIIEIKDYGKGIEPELLDDVFVPFFTTKTNGSGIGLSLSKQIIRLHGGSIIAHSILGTGTIFRIVI